ncbi:MAG: formylglycine-generating enzyme family protein [Desulfobacterales bacterium]|nr:formylglycine-generating enzyme family protein [Desulfobacterales bacterium]
MDVLKTDQGDYELVKLPGGDFLMGSEEPEESPPHEVHIPAFYMGRLLVTNEQYGRFLKENPAMTAPLFWSKERFNKPGRPVVGVNWNEAKSFAQWAGLRLPSESEWEYACRADGAGVYNLGDSEKDLDRAAWYKKNSGERTHVVGKKEPNGFGLYDMHGNAWEWVEDDWHDTFDGAPNDQQSWCDEERAMYRVVRGGGWDGAPRFCRSAVRGYLPADFRDYYLGFRLCKPLPSPACKEIPQR